MLADRDLQDQILNALDRESRLAPAGIGVAVSRGVVTLLGHVTTLQEKWTAERVVASVPGVRAIADELEVVWKGQAERTDTAIADDVARNLAWSTGVPFARLLPTVSLGWVTLAGTVEHEEQRYAAERAVRHLAGVTGVTNAIAIAEPAIPAPRVVPAAERLALPA